MNVPCDQNPPRSSTREGACAAAAGLLVALGLLKFGNPVIFDDLVVPPEDFFQFLVMPWPIRWGYGLLVAVLVISAGVWRWHKPAPGWVVALPFAWLAWQLVAGLRTVDAALTRPTLVHFAACLTCFYVGLFALSRVDNLRPFWLGILGGFGAVLLVGWQQHWGGLEATRRAFYQLPDWQQYPPEFVARLRSDRIYSTLFYPNSLAGGILLFLPLSLALVRRMTERSGWATRGLAGCVTGGLALACLYWSGSKAGWLIALFVGAVAFLSTSRLGFRWKSGVILVAAVVGLGAFAVRHLDYFQRGATSVSARLDYWRAAMHAIKEHPLVGTGPGTFQIAYRAFKPPEAESARLAHNDYLQQGSDAGIPALLLYSVLVAGSTGWLYPKSRRLGGAAFGVWLGLAGLGVQGLVEFPLFIPALAWPQFLFLGWLWGLDPQTGASKSRGQQGVAALGSSGA